MAASLRTARVGDAGEKFWQRLHVGGAEHEFRGSVVVTGIEHGVGQAGLDPTNQRADKHPLGGLCGRAVALASATETARIAHRLPIGGTVEGAVEMAWINKGFQQPQRVTEALLPVLRQATLTQRQDA